MRVAAGSLAAALGWRIAAAEGMSSRLQAVIPPSLYRENGYPHEMALFGIPEYGGTIAERLIHGGISDGVQKTWTLCSSDDVAAFKQSMPSGSPFILMVDRGECTYTSKVRRAEDLGASGVIIADNTCLCSDEPTQVCSKDYTPCEQKVPIMQDDGSGVDIAIPSFLMKKIDAKSIKDRLSEGQNIQMQMTLNFPPPVDRVEWSLWTSAMDTSAAPFKRDFKEVVKTLGPNAQFTPFYVVYDGTSYGCAGNGVSNCESLCTNRGRYCMTDPDFDTKAGVSGADVVRESLRQKCIWNIYGGENADLKDQGIGEKWWSYVNEFFSSCSVSGYTYRDAKCVEGAMKAAGVDKHAVNKCMTESGGTEDNQENTILEKELKEKDSKVIMTVPTVFVNNVAERGGISTAAVLSAICAGYMSGAVPEVCRCAGELSSDLVGECMHNRRTGGAGGGSSVGGTMFLLGSVVGAMIAAGYAHYKRTQT